MKIVGIDFTSSPSRSKPITCAVGEMLDRELHVNNVIALTDFRQFESALSVPGPWLAGLDFPFGQSQKLITNLNWPDAWEDYVAVVSDLDRAGFTELLEDYKEQRPTGDKEHRREIDLLASSISPQKLYGVPVGKMFYEGAKRLLATTADIIPVCRRDSPQVIVEAYPAVVARRFIAKRSYKNDQKAKQTGVLMSARQDIVNGLQSKVILDTYGFSLSLPDDLKSQLIQDATGDTLDAVLCAIQAGWAYMNRDRGYGIPDEASVSEGWIADPMFLNNDKQNISCTKTEPITTHENCPFCRVLKSDINNRIIEQNDLAFVVRDRSPVSEGHTLIIPNRHIGSFFETTKQERDALLSYLDIHKLKLDETFQPDAYNIGINDGAPAGQTVPHLHIHLIPRYKGDVADPRGGIRWLSPEKAKYWD